MKHSFAIVGCGTLGTALGRLLFQAGYPVVGVASRSMESAQKAGDAMETDRVTTRPWEVTREADMVFLTTSDGAIEGVCREIAQNKGFKEGGAVYHCSGALTSDILVSARENGALIASMHPLQSFAGARPGKNLFEGILVSVEGDPPAVSLARQIVADLGAHHARVKTEAKTLYHAAAVVASNYLVTLLSMAFSFNQAAGITPEESVMGLFPLIHGTLGNVEEQGIPMALTGPIARGDVSTIRRHLEEIRDKAPDFEILYKSLGMATIPLARAKGSLSEEAAREMTGLFAS